MTAASFHFKIGMIECMAISDYVSNYAADRLFTNAPKERVEQVLREHDLDPDALPSPYTCLFINTGKNKVLIDAGQGIGVHPRRGPYEGQTAKVLKANGVEA